ncbi:anthranilate synthase component I [Anaeromyxobacter diazotrophicus]|uniref:Anthranilate synthase component 1 n=1 Tax=Anaeromyxobacter diazotrophicus TaxID=2590199 RepID=A0A7I9VT23_9BACT|nr:anthranilate synthase component I [Anaeromyxobacter diazotrophicus]GEJ59378.1 anthranilate synthase component I [Anaeromyxobacter diazotrophicus]
MTPKPDLPSFLKLCRPGRAVPVRVEIEADTETPVSAFLKLSRGEEHAFLLESVEGGERSARFSFLGAGPRAVLSWRLGDAGDPVEQIRRDLASHRAVRVEGTPRFSGGLVGWFSYDAVRLFEPRVPATRPDELGFPDALFMDYDRVVAFDHRRHTLHVMAEVRCDRGDDPRALYAAAVARIEETLLALARPLAPAPPRALRPPAELRPRTGQAEFEAMVRRAREYVKAGDCQQIVLSQRFDAEVTVPAFDVYRALRRVNPSPYLFYLQEGERALVGSSPETLIKLEEGEVTLRPIAGTRRRGADAAEDARLEAELRADPKENAEHVMLVDLGRNDVGRVAEVGTVRVTAFKTVERYSHVMHLVSEVKGRLAAGLSAVDVLRAGFPAGTVTGSPKVRAMEIVDELEPARRGPYAGAVGYFDRGGDMEMCIAIRTLVQRGRRVSVQAGAGLVYDSKPAAEYHETVNKARACFAAVAQAETGDLEARPAAAPRRPAPRGRAAAPRARAAGARRRVARRGGRP